MTDRTTLDEERSFDASRFFYSRTDPRGVILYGNPLFFQVSDYAPEEMIGAPHKLVRHPDMPKGMFWLLWQTIQGGAPMGAYVKNRAKDGRFYWVFSIVSPTADGFLSVRMKPMAPHFAEVQPIYAAMREAEARGASPQASAALLAEELARLGHSAYSSFASAAATAEARARQTPSLAHEMSAIEGLEGLAGAIRRMGEEQRALLETFMSLHLVPTNMRILASRLEPSGGPISAISDSYKRASAEITDVLESMTGKDGAACRQMEMAVEDASFRVAGALLKNLAYAQFQTDAGSAQGEMAALSALVASAQMQARAQVDAVTLAVRKLRKDGEALQRLMSGLDQIRILGEVESGRNRNLDSGLSAIMEQLDRFHRGIHARLDAIINLSSRMRASAERVAA